MVVVVVVVVVVVCVDFELFHLLLTYILMNLILTYSASFYFTAVCTIDGTQSKNLIYFK